VLVEALEAGVSYVGLVASGRRGRAVLESLDVPEALKAVVHTPAGLDIGARAPADVAISILAQIVAERTSHGPEVAAADPVPVLSITPPATAVASAIDPICGMEVAASAASVHLDVDGERIYFCCEGCRTAFAGR
jgi:xanthine dehydrogenase accessory factor